MPRLRWRRLLLGAWGIFLVLLFAEWLHSYRVFNRLQYTSENLSVEHEQATNICLDSGSGNLRISCDSLWSRHLPQFQAALKVSGKDIGTKRNWDWVSYHITDNPVLGMISSAMRNTSGGEFIWDTRITGTPAAGFERRRTIIGVPYWAVFLVLMAPSLLLGVIYLNRQVVLQQRQSMGQCIFCGYDMRASPDRCPECGAEPARVQTIHISREHRVVSQNRKKLGY
ncbi:MAG TPA: hypothetical protein VHD56_18565 [Tepidisphaeraceae bacterium]|nr:hypothetical protein [Tepidisphaeraceae bacterium]